MMQKKKTSTRILGDPFTLFACFQAEIEFSAKMNLKCLFSGFLFSKAKNVDFNETAGQGAPVRPGAKASPSHSQLECINTKNISLPQKSVDKDSVFNGCFFSFL